MILEIEMWIALVLGVILLCLLSYWHGMRHEAKIWINKLFELGYLDEEDAERIRRERT